MRLAAPLALILLLVSAPIAAQDSRILVRLPKPIRDHMLANMRDHLAALHEIQTALASGKIDQAAELAESRLGMSSLTLHGGAHMAPYMPKPMQDMGSEMHRAASRFARTAQEGDLKKALADLGGVTQQCVACHAGYRVH